MQIEGSALYYDGREFARFGGALPARRRQHRHRGTGRRASRRLADRPAPPRRFGPGALRLGLDGPDDARLEISDPDLIGRLSAAREDDPGQ